MFLRIQTTWGRLAINQTPPQLRTATHIPPLELKTIPAEITVRRQPPRVMIDQSHVWAELGLRPALSLAREHARQGGEEAAAGTARQAREGDRMAHIESGEKVIPALARENCTGSAEVNIKLWPSRPPAITVEQGGLDFAVRPGGVETCAGRARVAGEFTRGAVQTYLVQKPRVDITVILDEKG